MGYTYEDIKRIEVWSNPYIGDQFDRLFTDLKEDIAKACITFETE